MKRKLSPAAKKAISQATKKRWQAYRRVKHEAKNGDDRLCVLLNRFDGTPFEMTREQFTERAINWALDKLGS